MDEALRRAYLAAMDIPLWIPRGEAEPVLVEASVDERVIARAAPEAAPSGERITLAAAAGHASANSVESRRPGRGQALLGGAELPGRPAAAAPRDTPAARPAAATAPGFSLGFARSGATLLIDEHPLGRAGAELAGAIAFVLERRRQPVESQDFSWPPRGAPLVAAEARDAVMARVDKFGGAGLKRLVLMGEGAACLLLGWDAQQWAARAPGLQRIEGLDCVVSLLPGSATMLQSPDAKRLAWQNLQLVPRNDA